MKYANSSLNGILPGQPPAGKPGYQIVLMKQDYFAAITENESVLFDLKERCHCGF